MARRKTTRLAFDALMVEGALIAPDMIADVAALKATAQSEADYRIPPGLKLRDEIGRSWRIAEALWARFSQARAGATAYAATQAFVDDLLRQVFGFASLEPVSSRHVGSRAFPVRRVALSGRVPIAIAPAGDGLDRGLDQFAEDHRKRSASLLVQELLNADEAARWGIATDGSKLRLLRDNASLTRPAYVEADLERIFQGGLYADFVALWLLIHESRFGASDALPSDCPLERWRDAGREAGAKARDRLGVGVEAALKELGAGFIEHTANGILRESIERGALTPQAFYEELLRLVYRLIFLFTTEDRGLLHDPEATEAARALYADGYSLARLRTQAARRTARDANHDLFEGLKIVFRSLWHGEKVLGLPALGGLFRGTALPNLSDAKISNKRLLEAVFRLAWITEDHTLMRVNWRDMETEELGSVYEALLELPPRFDLEARIFFFAIGDETKGNARKTSGSYYTPDSLVQLLLSSALEPVIERTVNENPSRPVEALLDLTILDPACGSGHFLLAAGRQLATRVAQLRSPGAPSAEDWRHALREVARRCLFGVDRNPMAVELCQTALWIESVDPGKPLTFLDAHIQCGDSLVGVGDLEVLKKGIPDDAYKPLSGDDKAVANAVKRVNRTQREQPKQRSLFVVGPPDLTSQARSLEGLPEDDVREVEAKARAFEAYRKGGSWWTTKVACDLYIAAFFRPKLKLQGALAGSNAADHVPTTADMWAALEGHPPPGVVTELAVRSAKEIGALHWPLAFPQVLDKGGFDCVLGNPPWERIKLQEEEFFATSHTLIASAKNKAERSQRINWLAHGMLAQQLHPEFAPTEQEIASEKELYARFLAARRSAEAASVFAHLDIEAGGRYPLTGFGDVNTYALFAETISRIAKDAGHAGFIVPTGIATDDSTKRFFSEVTQSGRLVSLFDFENTKKIFPAVATLVRFSLVTLGRSKVARFAFLLNAAEQIFDEARWFSLTSEDFQMINPNTLTCPVFRSRKDAEITKQIYQKIPVLVRKGQDGAPDENPWGISFMRMFDMSNDSHLFKTRGELQEQARIFTGTAALEKASNVYLPLYEAKMMTTYDHRFGSYPEGAIDDTRALPRMTLEEYEDVSKEANARFFVDQKIVLETVRDWKRSWFVCFRAMSNHSNIRRFISGVVPYCAAGNSLILMMPDGEYEFRRIACFVANLSSLVVDVVARWKVSGTNLNLFLVEQFPIITPNQYDTTDVEFISQRVIELIYTADSLSGFASDFGYDGRPFKFNPDRRAVLRAELDAYFARKYGLTREDLRYILDPSSVMGDDYPSETFRVLKESEERQFGEYRTQRLVLDAWDALERNELD